MKPLASTLQNSPNEMERRWDKPERQRNEGQPTISLRGEVSCCCYYCWCTLWSGLSLPGAVHQMSRGELSAASRCSDPSHSISTRIRSANESELTGLRRVRLSWSQGPFLWRRHTRTYSHEHRHRIQSHTRNEAACWCAASSRWNSFVR